MKNNLNLPVVKIENDTLIYKDKITSLSLKEDTKLRGFYFRFYLVNENNIDSKYFENKQIAWEWYFLNFHDLMPGEF